ncbi:group I truncated hemoglobin [Nitrospira sp. Kam-Ns4a]
MRSRGVRRASGWITAAVMLATLSCTGMRAGEGPATSQSLYDRLGGKAAIQAVVDEFVTNVAKDGRISGRFANVDIPKLKGHLVDQVCEATGGPCRYRGRDMKAAHAGMRITTGDFNALVEDLVRALDKLKVPEQEKRELLALLGPMQKDIVELPER